MYSKSIIAIAAALGAVNASPLLRRQESAISSAVSSAVSGAAASAISSVTGAPSAISSAAGSAVGSATSVASSASSAASSASSAASSAVSSAVVPSSSTGSAASSTGGVAPPPAASTTGAAPPTGNETFPLYPCPAGFLLTYAQVNQTVPISVTQAGQAAGEWASSPLFPNVTDAMGGTMPGATHTINVMGIAIPEVLVNATSNMTSGYAQWTWNNTAPVTAGPVTLSNYSTVFRVYDPDFTTTQMIGNTTFVQIFTNACANDQAAAAPLLQTLGQLELGLLGAAISGNATMNSTMPAGMASTAAMSATSAVGTAFSMPSSEVSSVASSASSVASGPVSSASSAASGARSSASGAASAVTGAASSAASGAVASVTSAAAAATSAAAGGVTSAAA